MENERLVTALSEFVNTRFDQNAITSGWEHGVDVVPWDECPDGYKDTMRLTMQDLLESEWLQDLIKETQRQTIRKLLEEIPKEVLVPRHKVASWLMREIAEV